MFDGAGVAWAVVELGECLVFAEWAFTDEESEGQASDD